MGVVLPLYPQDPPPGWCSRFIGLPYEEGGRGPDKWDCWGIFMLVLQEQFGVRVPAYDGVHWGPDNRINRVNTFTTIEAERALHWTPVAPGEERPGDGIVLTIALRPLHVGVIAQPGWMLHGAEGSESALERYDGMLWRNRVDGFYRLKGGQ